MEVLLDTHILIWFASNPVKLSKHAMSAITEADKLYVSAITAWEIGTLISKGRLQLSMSVNDWIQKSKQISKIQWISLDTDIALLSTQLPGMLHSDPADRIIVSTALKLNCPLITADRLILRYKHVQTIG
jgi:PIN domain nuclease of toxin-antitoxin system